MLTRSMAKTDVESETVQAGSETSTVDAPLPANSGPAPLSLKSICCALDVFNTRASSIIDVLPTFDEPVGVGSIYRMSSSEDPITNEQVIKTTKDKVYATTSVLQQEGWIEDFSLCAVYNGCVGDYDIKQTNDFSGLAARTINDEIQNWRHGRNDIYIAHGLTSTTVHPGFIAWMFEHETGMFIVLHPDGTYEKYSCKAVRHVALAVKELLEPIMKQPAGTRAQAITSLLVQASLVKPGNAIHGLGLCMLAELLPRYADRALETLRQGFEAYAHTPLDETW